MPKPTNQRKGRRTRRRPRKKAAFRSFQHTPVLGMMSNNPLPQRIITTLIYSNRYRLPAGVSPFGNEKLFRINGPFDPEVSVGIGQSQPRGYDQLLLMYSTYAVHKVQIRLDITPIQPTVNNSVLGCYVSQNPAIDPDYSNALENTYTKYEIGNAWNGNSPVTINYNVDVARFFGIKTVLTDEELQSLTNNNPVKQLYLHQFCHALNPAQNPPTVDVNIRIKYVMSFLDPITPPQST